MKTIQSRFLFSVFFHIFILSDLFIASANAELTPRTVRGLSVTEVDEVIALPENETDVATGALIISMDLAKAYSGNRIQLKPYQDKLDAMADEIRMMLAGENYPELVLNTISQYLFEIKGFNAQQNDKPVYHPQGFLVSEILDNKKAFDLGMAMVYVGLAERLGLSVSGLAKKDAFYLAYEDEKEAFIINLNQKGQVLAKETSGLQDVNPVEGEQSGLSPRSMLGIYLREAGKIYIALKKPALAREYLLKAEKLHPGDADTLVTLGDLYKEEGELDQARAAWRRAIERNKQYLNAYLRLSVSYMKEHRHDEAQAVLEDFKKQDPKGEADAIIGIHYIMQKDYDNAILHFEAYKKSHPREENAYKNLAQTYRENKQFEESARVYREAIQIFPNNIEFYIALATIYSQMGKTDELLNFAKEALAIKPNHPTAKVFLAIGYHKSARQEEANAVLQEVMKENPKEWAPWALYGEYLMEQKKYDEALKYLGKAEKLDPPVPDVLYQKGLAYYYQRKPHSAQLEFEKGMKQFEGKQQGLFHLGLAMTDTYRHKYDNAIAHLDKAKALGFNNADLEKRLAEHRK